VTPANPAADWAQIRALFDEAMSLPAEDRAGYLAGITAGAGVLAEVVSLLEQADRTSALDQPAAVTGGFSPAEGVSGSRAGEQLGPWCIESLLGRGGMGEVWLARRADGAYAGVAAIKVLRRGMDSGAVLGRFAQEQQALARLAHPHIARLLDAGRTPDGLPYFVMEHVDGRPISEACEGRPLEQRLALFLQLADAVAYAHRQLLVHRDLKPSNVLVSAVAHGAATGMPGSVKLLDFGIAKALDPLQDVRPDQTLAGERPFTPHFASPEQVRGEPVGTATDIYSLGVLLYLMLTGIRPYGREASTPHEAARSVLDELPTRPSALSPGLVKDPQWLQTRRRLEGDLDNILLKTLDKSIDGRYASVDALAADIRAYLGGYPVSAQAPTAAYRLRKFVARNRLTTAAIATATLSVSAALAVSLWQGHQLRQQQMLAERRFNEVRQFARTMLFEVDTALKDGPTAGREKLIATAQQYLDRLVQESQADPPLLRDLAESYERLGEIQGGTMQANVGRPDDARRSLLQALALRQRLEQLEPHDQANRRGLFSVSQRLGDDARARGDLAQALDFYAQALERVRSLAQAQPDDLALRLRRIEAERYWASVLYWPFNASLGQHARARPVIERLAHEMRGLLAAHPGDVRVLESAGGLLNQWSDFQRLAGELPAALATVRESLAVAQALARLEPAKPTWQRWLYLAEGRLGDALIDAGDTEGGLASWQQSLRRREALAQADPNNERAQRNLANGFGPLAEHLSQLGRHAQALDGYRQEHALLSGLRERFPQVKALGPRLEESARDLAVELALAGRSAEALALSRALQEQRAVREASRREDDNVGARFATQHARVVLRAGRQSVSAEQRAAAVTGALKASAHLLQVVQREPFNAHGAREAASVGAELALDLALAGDPRACAAWEDARTVLQALHAQARLGHPAQRWLQATPAALSGCGAPSPHR
jgi:eukaryotic-like serine/threonine-protein kinase